MSDLRTAALRALDALQKIYLAPEHDEYIRVWWPACEEAITALRVALAAEPVLKPAGVVTSMVKGGVTWHIWPDQMPDGTTLYAAAPIIKPEIKDDKPVPPPETQTEAEKIAYCAGWWAALEAERKELLEITQAQMAHAEAIANHENKN